MQMTYSSPITSKGQVLFPKNLRDQLGLFPRGQVVFEVNGKVATVRKAPTVAEMYGFIKTKKHFTEKQLQKGIEDGVADEWRKKIKSGRR